MNVTSGPGTRAGRLALATWSMPTPPCAGQRWRWPRRSLPLEADPPWARGLRASLVACTAPPGGQSSHRAPSWSGGSWLSPILVSPLQGKEEFEKTQKELLEKGNIMRQGKGQLELQQVRTRTPAASAKAVCLSEQACGAEPGP